MFIKQSLACYRSGTGDCSFYIGLVLDCVPLELRERMDRGQRCFDSFPRTWVDVEISCLQDNMITKLKTGTTVKKEAGSTLIHTHGSQSTLMAPQVLLPHNWMNFSIEKTPVRSSTLLPHSLWRPLLLTAGSLEIHPI